MEIQIQPINGGAAFICIQNLSNCGKGGNANLGFFVCEINRLETGYCVPVTG